MKLAKGCAFLFSLTLLLSTVVPAQIEAPDRITQPFGPNLAALRGNVHPKARPSLDRGEVAASLPMQRITIFFKPTQAQQDALDTLLVSQQDPSSPTYHKWLTPEQYASRFGLSQSDFDKTANWLTSQGLSVVDKSRARTWIAFNGTAAQIKAALHTSIHEYVVNDTTHYANASEPALPAALASVVLGIRGLNDFRLKPRAIKRLKSNFTSSISGNHYLAPDDFATIYNLQGLYNSGIDGTGQKIAVVGQTDLILSDIATFRSTSNLPQNPPQVILVPGSADPGVVKDDIGEADLDVEWAGAVAKNATIVYVNSKNGVFDSMIYAIDKNLAPVISLSYGDCEPNFSSLDVTSLTALMKQANAQGQTIVAASGDSGAADCDYSTSPTTQVTAATHGLAVDLPAAMPYITGIGGNSFSEGTGTFWNTSNNANNGSAISYIPEVSWNDTAFEIANGGGLSSGGGGKSTLFPKPSWQTGIGVPDDGARDVPDISFNASPAHDGYIVCSQGSCVNGYRAADSTLTIYGGTSAGAPSFAGIVALINQKTNSSQGNINPALYAAAANIPGAFHDVSTGNNMVPCKAGTTDCAASGSIGYSAGTGYDLVTGLGSVDGTALSQAFASAPVSNPDFQFTVANQTVALSRGTFDTEKLTITALNGFADNVTLTCAVSASLGATTCTVSPTSISTSGTATLTITAPTQIAALHPSAATPFVRWMGSSFALFVGAFFLIGEAATGTRKHIGRNLFLVLLLIALCVGLVACGGGSSAHTGTGSNSGTTTTPLSGTVTVQAVSGSLTHSVQLAVTVK